MRGLHDSFERKNGDELDEFLMKSLMGSRIDQELIAANNALTLIDRLDRQVAGTRNV